MRWSNEKQLELYDLLLRAKYSDNTDYIQEQLDKIYSIILENNIGLGDDKMDYTMIYNTKDKTINGLTLEEYEMLVVALDIYEENYYSGRGERWQKVVNNLKEKMSYLAIKSKEVFGDCKNIIIDEEVEILKRVVRDYKTIKKDIEDRVEKGYNFENMLDYIRHLSSCDITNTGEDYFDFNYCDMCISVYKDKESCYLGDIIEVWNDRDLEYLNTYNNISEIEKELSKYE